MKAIVLAPLVLMLGCAKTAPYPNSVRGFLVDEELNVFAIPGGDNKSIRPFVDDVLARNNLPRGIRYSIAPNGLYVACLDAAKKMHVVELSKGKCLQTLSLPQDCVEVGDVSWKPDSGGFVCHMRTSKYTSYDPLSPAGHGYCILALGPRFQYQILNQVGDITECWGAVSLTSQAWCSNDCFVFGDGNTIKACDVSKGTVQNLFEGYSPIGVYPDQCVYRDDVSRRGIRLLRRIGGGDPVSLTNRHDVRMLNAPVVSPDGNVCVFLNEQWGSSLFGLAAGLDYWLTVYERRQDKYTSTTRIRDDDTIHLIANAVWVQPVDAEGWRTWLSKKTR